MKTVTIETRFASQADAESLARVHDLSWRTAYQGVIPGSELEKIISRRGPVWWQNAVEKGNRILLLTFGDDVVGYANYGRNRAKGLAQDGEIYELYLSPEYQGLGLGDQLFAAARKDMQGHSLKSLVVWVLTENEQAIAFFKKHTGKAAARSSERFGTKVLDKTAFIWPNIV